jgi:hypothetical protein
MYVAGTDHNESIVTLTFDQERSHETVIPFLATNYLLQLAGHLSVTTGLKVGWNLLNPFAS